METSGIFYDLSEWSNKVLPSVGNVSLKDSGAALIPYEYYFDGNEMYNITAKGDYFWQSISKFCQ